MNQSLPLSFHSPPNAEAQKPLSSRQKLVRYAGMGALVVGMVALASRMAPNPNAPSPIARPYPAGYAVRLTRFFHRTYDSCFIGPRPAPSPDSATVLLDSNPLTLNCPAHAPAVVQVLRAGEAQNEMPEVLLRIGRPNPPADFASRPPPSDTLLSVGQSAPLPDGSGDRVRLDAIFKQTAPR